MDDVGFDRLIRSLSSRRGMLAAALGGLALARHAAASAATCRPKGMTCDPNSDMACCAGVCKKHKGGYACVPAGEAFGCTTDPASDFCASGSFAHCPNASGTIGFCVVARKKRKREPLCVVANDCMDCRSDADCAVAYNNSSARCIKHCHKCALAGTTTLCVVPMR